MTTGSLFDKLCAKFEEDVLTALKFEKIPTKLSVIRHHSRPVITTLIHTALMQGDATIEVKLALHFAAELLASEETLLAREVYEIALKQAIALPNKLQSIFQQVDAIVGIVLCDHKDLTSCENSYDAPMVVSKYLHCLTQLRSALDLLFEMSTRQQEENAWKILNACKLIYKIGQPLAWHSCGKYIVESFLFAAGAMESVINLCTVRHMTFRLKLYSSALSTMLGQGMLLEAKNVLKHATQEVNNLVERESLDPPIPDKIQAVLSLARDDLQVMTQLMAFFESPEDITGILEYSGDEASSTSGTVVGGTAGDKVQMPPFGVSSKMNNMCYTEKVLCECIRVHQLTAGGANEAWKKRSNCLVKLFHAFVERTAASRAIVEEQHEAAVHAASLANSTPAVVADSGSPGGTAPPVHTDAPELEPPFCFSVATLLEVALLVLFDPIDNDVVSVDTVLEQLWEQVGIFKQQSEAGIGLQTVGWRTQVVPSLTTHNHHNATTNHATNALTQGLLPGEVPVPVLSMNEWELKELDILQDMLQIIALGDSTAVTSAADAAPSISVEIPGDVATTGVSSASTGGAVPPVWLQLCQGLIRKVEEVMYSDHERRRQHFLQRVVVCLWSRVIFPRLQGILSLDNTVSGGGAGGWGNNGGKSSESVATASLAELAPLLLVIVRIMDVTHMEDAVLVSSLSLITGLVFRHVGDYRGALSLLRQALVTLDNFRAARVDASLHLPDDKRDVYALQRASFSCAADEDDWFHSLKRLGARAYAGFGLFGTGSVMDRTDQALSEINVDMLALYFRTEIEYNLKQARERATKKNSKAGATTAGAISAAGSATVSRTSSAAKVGTMLTASLSDPDVVHVEDMPCVKALKAMCNKNGYARALLYIELARLECSGNEETQKGLLKTAKDCIEEAEADEALLKQSFVNLDVIRSPTENSSSTSLHHPIVLARTHKSVYVCPVGSRLTHRKAAYFRVFAKEQGSGTAISLSNDDLQGCETAVKSADLTSPSAGIVCVRGLVQGERYVFGAAAFTDQHSVVGQISGSTVAIAAVNPLPTDMLWSILAETSQDLGIMDAAKFAAGRTCARYFDAPPHFDTVTLGKGVNISTDPHLCMLAVQQSSPVLLRYFVRSFLIFEAPARDRQQGSGVIHWDMKLTEQERTIFRLRRIGLVIMIAAYVNSHELIVRCLCLGYAYLCYLTEYDEINMAPYTQQPLMMFLSALQTIPKRHWHSLEHHLYCRLLSHLIKASIINHSTLSVAALLTQLYMESSSTDAADDCAKHLNEDVSQSYLALVSSLKLNNDLLFPPEVQEQLHGLFKTEDETKGWQRRPSHIAYSVLGKAVGVSHGSLSDLEHSLKSTPEKGSQLLNTLVQFITELRQQLTVGDTPKSTVVSLCGKIMNSFAVVESLFAPRVMKLIIDWKLSFLKISPAPVEQANGNAGVGTGSGNQTEATTATPSGENSRANTEHVKSRRRADLAEEREQMKALGALSFSIARVCFPDSNVRQHFPHQTIGPFAVVMPTDGTLGNHSDFAAASNVSSTATLTDKGGDAATGTTANKTADLHTAPNDYVRYLCASVTLLVQSRNYAMAVTSAVTLWGFLVDEFQDPRTFAQDYRDVKEYLHLAGEELVQLLEALVGQEGGEEGAIAAGIGQGTMVQAGSHKSLTNVFEDGASQYSTTSSINATGSASCPPRDVKEYLFVCRDLLVFLIKVLWILEEFTDVVEIGSRVVNVYTSAQGVEYCKPFDKCLPLITHAQEQLLKQANGRLERRKNDLEVFVADYEEQQRKKRKKKVRIARLEKDDSELKFDADKAVLDEKIYRAEMMMKTCTAKLDSLMSKQRKFESLSSTSTQLLDKLRKGREEVYLECVNEVGIDGNFNSCLKVKHIREKIDGVFYNFNHVCHLLREKKDKVTLIEALKEQGDLYLLVGKQEEALGVWRDAVDGLFNVMDSYKQWRPVVEAAIAHPDTVIIEGCLPTAVILGKLSRFTAANDWDAKAGHCRMAAELCKVPFMDSSGHPVSVGYGFGAYVCRQLGGVSPLIANSDKLSIVGLHDALAEVVYVLFQEGCLSESLPVVVLWEHLHSNYTRRADYWLTARLWRVRLLVSLHLFAQAAAMLASIETSLPAILQGKFATPLAMPNLSPNNTVGGGTTPQQTHAERQKQFDTQSNGFDCYGHPPFYSHLPPHHPDNVACLQWVAGFEADFVSKLPQYKYEAPVIKREADLYAAALAEYKEQSAIYLRDVVNAPKGKGAPPPPTMAEPVAPEAPVAHSGPMFSHLIVGELQYVCAKFLAEVASLDTRLSNPHYAALQLISADADRVLHKSLDTIARCVTTAVSTAVHHESEGHTNSVGAGAGANANAASPPSPSSVTAAHANNSNHHAKPGSASANSLTAQLERIDENVSSLYQSCNWTSLYGRCVLLAAKQFISHRKLKDARALLLGFLRKLQPALGTRFSSAVKAVITQHWFACKDLLVEIAMAQARYDDCVRMCSQFSQETSQSFNGFWLRSFVLKRSIAYYRLGYLEDSEHDCDALFRLYANAAHLRDLGLVRGMVHKATILRERVMTIDSSMSVVAVTMQQAIHWVKRATDMVEQMCRRLGGFTGGADANMSFVAPNSAILKYDVFSPLIHSLSNIHSNDPVLSLHVVGASGKKPRALQEQQRLSDSTTQAANWSTSNVAGQAQRRGPVDGDERYIESPFGNIYLQHMRVLAVCQSSLCGWLQEVRTSEAVKYFASLPPVEAFSLDNGGGGEAESGAEGSGAGGDDGEELEDLSGSKYTLIPMTAAELLEMQSWVGEDALKVLRYVVYCPPTVRVSLLLTVSKSRVAKLLIPEPSVPHSVSGQTSVSASGHATPARVPVSVSAAANSVVQCDSGLFLSALRTGLQLGVAAPEAGTEASPIAGGGVHAWGLLNDICIEFVECYGNNRLQWCDNTDDGQNRLKMASLYLILACKLKNQFNLIVKSPLKLCTLVNAEAGAAANPMTEPLGSSHLNAIVSAFMTTSTASSYITRDRAKTIKSVDEAPALPMGADVATGRDAACLLSAVLRECDPYWQDGYETDLCIDTHHLLRTQYPSIYASQCCLPVSSLPTPSTELSVFVGGVYSQWVSMNCVVPPGHGKKVTPKGSPSKALLKSTAHVYDEHKSMFNWYTGYFLLGVSSNADAAPSGNKGDTGTETTGQPFLTKVVLRRKDVVDLEQQFRHLRTRLAAAVINTATPLTEAGEVLGSLLCRIIMLVNESNDTGCEATFKLIENASNGHVTVDVLTNSSTPVPCKVPLTDQTLKLFSECFTNGMSVDGAIDTAVCTFLRVALLGK